MNEMMYQLDEQDLCDCIHPQSVQDARHALRTAPPADDLATLFGILGDATRMKVLVALADRELCVSDLALATGVNRTTISHQLRVLRVNNLVRRRRDGKVLYYALDDDHVTQLLRLAIDHANESRAAEQSA